MDNIRQKLIDLLSQINRPEYLIKLYQYAHILKDHENA